MIGVQMKKCIAVASVVSMLLMTQAVQAQQGKYVNSASARLVKLIDQANKEGFKLQNNGFSIGGGWLQQGTDNWVSIVTTTLNSGSTYRIVAVGDMDAKDVDVEVVDAVTGKTVARDTLTNPEAIVDYRPTQTGRYTIRLRLYSSNNSAPCVVMAIILKR